MTPEDLSSELYSTPKVYSDEATLLDLYAKLVRTHDWKDDYLAPLELRGRTSEFGMGQITISVM